MPSQDSKQEPFPWDLNVYDAHCHPTDTMSSIPSIPSMRTRCLTVMGTRAEDQSLVSGVADEYGVKSADVEKWSRDECMVPCFGWHPWFAHMMYVDDSVNGEEADRATLQGEKKIRHYQNVLQPFRKEPSEEDIRIFLSLPDPLPFSTFLNQTRANLQRHPLALVGEIGLDRSFRIPEPWGSDQGSQRDDSLTPGGREGRRLTPFRCNKEHQRKIFQKQLELAAECGRAVSVHGVQAHGIVFEAVKELWIGHEKEVLSKRERKRRGTDHPSNEVQPTSNNPVDISPKPYPPRICLHSFSGSASTLQQYLNPAIPVDVFFSFSTAINLGDEVGEKTPGAFIELMDAVPEHMLLVESDLHTAGPEMDRRIEDMARRICEVKGWGLEDGVGRLGNNWRRFVFGI